MLWNTAFGTVLLQAGQTAGKLQQFSAWALSIFNILIGVAAMYYILRRAIDFFQGDHQAGQRAVMTVVGLVLWFGAQALIGDFGIQV